MNISETKKREYIERLLIARMSILSRNGFFGLLLMHVKFTLDEQVATAATDGNRIIFSPKFLDELSDDELIFVMLHEIMHIVLRHCNRGKKGDPELFNIACDIVVNSNILRMASMDRKAITLKKYGEAMHEIPGGREGFDYTAEEVYNLIIDEGKSQGKGTQFDEHGLWGDKGFEEDAIWRQRISSAYAASKGRCAIPAGIAREVEKLLKPRVDWRTILNEFVQEEIVDYSFLPPDHRFQDSPFFLPDFNDTDFTVKNILFMIDTSASMSEEQVARAYSEIKGAIDQYNGRLEGWLGFFDAEVVPPKPFSDEGEFRMIKPKGGGGTDFKIIFDHINSEMADREIASIIIMTDGYAPFPKEASANGVPVLWLINNEMVTPPWGKVARL